MKKISCNFNFGNLIFLRSQILFPKKVNQSTNLNDERNLDSVAQAAWKWQTRFENHGLAKIVDKCKDVSDEMYSCTPKPHMHKYLSSQFVTNFYCDKSIGATEQTCKSSAKLDLQIIVDSSGSVGADHFKTMMEVRVQTDGQTD